MLIAALIGALFASLATILALNFVAAEKRIEKKITHQYGVAAAQFDRELGTLLGPAIIDGNAMDIIVRKGQQNIDILLGNAPLTLLVPAALLSHCRASIAPGTTITGWFMRGSMGFLSS